MTITVTQKHIDEGTKGHCVFCPVALAITEAIGAVRQLVVTCTSARIDGQRILMPQEAWEFIRAFDTGKPVSPFSFDLSYPQEAAQ